jgi:hypothetical protein
MRDTTQHHEESNLRKSDLIFQRRSVLFHHLRIILVHECSVAITVIEAKRNPNTKTKN